MNQQAFSFLVRALEGNILYVFVGLIVLAVVLTNWITKVNFTRSTLVSFIEEIRGDIKEIFRRLPAETALSSSPITLTELGQQVAEEIKVDSWLNKYVGNVQKQISPDTNPYEIQDVCFRYADEQLMEELTRVAETNKSASFIKADIELSAYNHGLTLDKVTRVVGVKLRDQILRNFNMQAPE